MTATYQDTSFSPQRVTRLLMELVRTAQRFGRGQTFLFEILSKSAHQRTAVALEMAAARLLALLAAPLMPEFAQKLWADLGYSAPMHWETQPYMVPGGQKISAVEPIFFPVLDEEQAQEGV